MDYKWNIEAVERHRKYYQHLLKGSKVYPDQGACLKEKISYFKEMEQLIKQGYYEPKEQMKLKYADKNKYLLINTLKDYYYIHPKVEKIMLEAMSVLAHISQNYQEVQLPTIDLTNEELIEMSLDFSKWLPSKKYNQAFKSLTQNSNNQIQFSTSTSGNKGITFPFYKPKYRPYFLINRDHTIDDFTTLNHELFHGIFYQTDEKTTSYSNHFLLLELEGSFSDYLSLEYLREITDKKKIKGLENSQFIAAYDDFISFYLINSAVKLFCRKKDVSLENCTKRMLKDDIEFYLNESILQQSLQESPHRLAQYSLSYLINLDLETIYENDPEQAFYHLEEIRKNKTDNIFENLREN